VEIVTLLEATSFHGEEETRDNSLIHYKVEYVLNA